MRDCTFGSPQRWVFVAVMLSVVTAPRLSQAFQSTAKPNDAKRKSSQEPAAEVKLGLNLHDPAAFQGYTLLSPLGSKKSFLLDMDGRVVRTWECGCTPLSSYLLENGNLLRFGTIPQEEVKFGRMPGGAGRLQEFTFDGELVWQFDYDSETRYGHHDAMKLPNGNVLMIAWERKSRDEAIAAGRAPDSLHDKPLIPCFLLEIKPSGKSGGEIVWEWHIWDHLIQDHDPSKANYGSVAEHPELIDVNFGGAETAPPQNAAPANPLGGLGYVAPPAAGQPIFPDPDWTHCNGVDYNAELDQIVISVHGFSEFWIIDHSTTTEEAKGHTGGRYGKGGDLLYRWGNPQAYRAGTKADQKLFAQHNAHWIPKGLPGAGHILLFNNRQEDETGKFSSVDEIVLPVNESGHYQRPTGERFGPEEAAWSYTASPKTDFYSNFISGAQRLPNGNTLICSGAHGIVFEVTADKQMVWKYINPTKESIFDQPPGGGPPSPEIGKLLPRHVLQDLKLSDEQQAELAKIEREAEEKLEGVLNEKQRQRLAELRKSPSPPPAAGPPAGGPNFGPPGRGGAGSPPAAPPGVPPDLLAGPPGGTSVFRATRYGVDYPAFTGKDMTPGKTLVQIVEAEAKTKEQAKQ